MMHGRIVSNDSNHGELSHVVSDDEDSRSLLRSLRSSGSFMYMGRPGAYVARHAQEGGCSSLGTV